MDNNFNQSTEQQTQIQTPNAIEPSSTMVMIGVAALVLLVVFGIISAISFSNGMNELTKVIEGF